MSESDDRPVPPPAAGPLDQMFPGLRERQEKLPRGDVHPRALELPLEAGGRALVLATWQSPPTVQALHAALRPLVEAALLAELSQPLAQLREQETALTALQLFAFEAFAFDPTPALAPFALEPNPRGGADDRAASALLRREAQRVEGPTPDDPVLRFVSPFARATDPRVQRAEAKVLASGPDGPWGAEPGVLARAFADALSAEGLEGVEPTHAGIGRLERALVPDATGAIRWMSPVSFQALCDLLAVSAHGFGMEVQWGVCEPDEDTQLAPPPVIRVQRGSTGGHVPLGEHVLRWCVMPRRFGEDIPPLADWAQHEFGEP